MPWPCVFIMSHTCSEFHQILGLFRYAQNKNTDEICFKHSWTVSIRCLKIFSVCLCNLSTGLSGPWYKHVIKISSSTLTSSCTLFSFIWTGKQQRSKLRNRDSPPNFLRHKNNNILIIKKLSSNNSLRLVITFIVSFSLTVHHFSHQWSLFSSVVVWHPVQKGLY